MVDLRSPAWPCPSSQSRTVFGRRSGVVSVLRWRIWHGGLVMRALRTLPKAELHLLLAEAMRAATMAEFAADAGMPAPDPRAFTTFAEFQRVFPAAFAVMQARPENLMRVVREIVADAATDGAVWVQPHFNPFPYTRNGSPEQVLEAVIEAGREEGARRGIGFGLTIAAQGTPARPRRCRWHNSPHGTPTVEFTRWASPVMRSRSPPGRSPRRSPSRATRD
jgi:hypothetical protein